MSQPTREELLDRALLLQTIEERRLADPLSQFQPYPKQREFIEIILGSRYYENWFFAANRAGKTLIGAAAVAQLSRFGIPENEVKPSIGPSVTVFDRATSAWCVSLDFPASRDLLQPKLFDNGFVAVGSLIAPFIPKREIAEWRVSDQILKLKNGSIIGFKSCDSGRQKFQGVDRDIIWFDEEPPKPIYEECIIRVGTRRLRIIGTATLLPPEGQTGGVSWIFPDIIKPVQQGKNTLTRIFSSSIYDNPYIPKEEIARLENTYPEGSIERRIRLNGELLPGIGGSRAYGNFNYALHVNKHMTPMNPRLPLVITLDFNVDPMVGIVGQRTHKLFRIFEEIVLSPGDVSEMGRMFRQLHPEHRAEIWVYGDASGNARNAQTNRTNYQLFMNELRNYPVPVRLKLLTTNPSVSSRINAVNRAFQDEYGEIGVEVSPHCEELIADFEGVLRDGRGGILKSYNWKDPYSRRTHTSDAFGYWVFYEQPVTSEPLKSNKPNFQSSDIPRHTMKRPTYGFSK